MEEMIVRSSVRKRHMSLFLLFRSLFLSSMCRLSTSMQQDSLNETAIKQEKRRDETESCRKIAPSLADISKRYRICQSRTSLPSSFWHSDLLFIPFLFTLWGVPFEDELVSVFPC